MGCSTNVYSLEKNTLRSSLSLVGDVPVKPVHLLLGLTDIIFKEIIFACAESLLPHMGFLYLQQAGATLQVQCEGFSCYRAQALGHVAFSSCAMQVVTHGLSSPQPVGSAQTRDRTHVPCTGRRILNHLITR